MYVSLSPSGLGAVYLRSRRRGLGATPSVAQVISAGAGAGVGTGLSTKSIVSGGVASGLAIAAAYDPEPISKAILAISAAFVGPLTALVNRGCGQTCIVASKAANDATDAANQVKTTYWAAPAPRPRSLQVAALQALQNIADTLRAACSNPALGDAGKRCISERLDRGGTAPWCPTGTGCDYWVTYYDPIANDPNVAPDPGPLSTAGAEIGNALGIGSDFNWARLLVPAAVMAVAAVALGGE